MLPAKTEYKIMFFESFLAATVIFLVVFGLVDDSVDTLFSMTVGFGIATVLFNYI